MTSPSKFFVVIGCLLFLIAVIVRCIGFYEPLAMRVIKPLSFLISANTSFILAVLLKK